MRKAISILVITLLVITIFILKSTDTRAEGTRKEYTHNFTTDELTDSYFDITGSISSDKSPVNYNGLTLTICLKMESKTKVTFNNDKSAQLILVLDSDKNVKIDGMDIQAVNGIISVNVMSGTHVIEKADVTNLYYIQLIEDEEQETSSISAEETSTPKETITEDTTVDDAAEITPQITYGDILILVSIAFLCGICCVIILQRSFR